MIKLFIDADPLVYRSGFACEDAHYDVIGEEADGSPFRALFERDLDNGKTARKVMEEYQEEFPTDTFLEVNRVVTVQPVEHALHITNQTVRMIEDEVRQEFHTNPDTILSLSGPGNYRFQLATIKPYKGNRDPSHIPVHYQAIRNFLSERWGARVIHGREADDEVSIRAWQMHRGGSGDYCIATIDKDLDQVPGWHYDYMKHVFYHVSDADARKALWVQILAGDGGDNVPGCWKTGVGGARKIVQEHLDIGATDRQLWEAIVNQYDFSKLLPGCPYADRGAAMAALETAQLVYVQQRPGELWAPPGESFGVIEGDHDD